MAISYSSAAYKNTGKIKDGESDGEMNGGKITVAELRKKRAICIENGKVLGRLRDIVFDTSGGRVISVRLRPVFGRSITVDWERIVLVGEDTVLVEKMAAEGKNVSGGAKAFVLFE